jgi:MFS family permease
VVRSLGLGCVFGSLITGRLLDRSYNSAASAFRASQNPPLDADTELTQQKYPEFALEHARLVHTWWLVFVFVGCTAAYGWSVEYHIAIPLVLQFLIAFTATSVFNINSTLMIDLYPSKPASATAIVSFFFYHFVILLSETMTDVRRAEQFDAMHSWRYWRRRGREDVCRYS